MAINRDQICFFTATMNTHGKKSARRTITREHLVARNSIFYSMLNPLQFRYNIVPCTQYINSILSDLPFHAKINIKRIILQNNMCTTTAHKFIEYAVAEYKEKYLFGTTMILTRTKVNINKYKKKNRLHDEDPYIHYLRFVEIIYNKEVEAINHFFNTKIKKYNKNKEFNGPVSEVHSPFEICTVE